MRRKQVQYLIYRIYYDSLANESGEVLAYVGRTKQKLSDRLRGHVFGAKMHRVICARIVTRIEYAELPTEADMNLYEIYHILTDKPLLNRDDTTKDLPTVELPPLQWMPYEPPRWGEWLAEIDRRERSRDAMMERQRAILEEMSLLRRRWHSGEIDRVAYEERMRELEVEREAIAAKMHSTLQRLF